MLTGNNGYTGATRVERGILTLQNGGVIRSNVTILAQPDPDSTGLQFNGGTPRVIGNVVNGGSVFLTTGNTTGTIEGNYTQQPGAQLMIALGANALQVTGNATINGGVRVHGFVSGYVPQNGTRQDLIHAAGPERHLQYPSHFHRPAGLTLVSPTYGYDSNNAWLNVIQVSVTAAASGLSASAQGPRSAWKAHSQCSTATPACRDRPSVPRPVRCNGPEGPAGPGRQPAEPVRPGACARRGRHLRQHRHVAACDCRALRPRTVHPRLRGTWQSALGEAGQGSFAGNSADSRGWMAGQDLPLGGNGLMGVAFGETRSNGGSSFGGDRGRDRQAQAQLYAGWSQGRGYALAQFGSGQFTRALDRQLLLGAGVYGVSARYGGRFSSASVEGGYRLGRAGASLTPYLGASTTRVDTDAFNELGGFGFGLRGDATGCSAARCWPASAASVDGGGGPCADTPSGSSGWTAVAPIGKPVLSAWMHGRRWQAGMRRVAVR